MNKAMQMSVLLASVLLLAGCTVRFDDVPAGALQRETKEVDAAGARVTRVNLEMGAGEMNVAPAVMPDRAMRATLTYNASAGDPIVTYAVRDGTGDLVLSQSRRDDVIYLRTYRNSWDVYLSDALTEQLNVAMGAGNAHLRLSGLPLRKAQVAVGAGLVLLDLTGKWENDATVDVSTGAGRLDIRLPDETGVEVVVNDHLGGLEATGLTQSASGVYRNDAFGQSPTTLRVHVSAGIGQVVLAVAQ